MGKRGPGAGRQRQAGAGAEWFAGDLLTPPDPIPSRAWEAEGLTRAERVVAFIESLPVTKGFGVGGTVQLEPFQRDWILSIYDAAAGGQRQVRTGLLSVARGNGKTVLCAGLALCHLVGPEAEPRGECYSAAATKEQSALIFAEMEATILATPWMAARLNV